MEGIILGNTKSETEISLVKLRKRKRKMVQDESKGEGVRS